MTPNRFVSAAFGMLMAAAAAVDGAGWVLVAAAIAAAAVLAGILVRSAATAAVLAAACAIALSEPQPLLAAVSGLSAAAYLVLRHTTMTRPTVIGLLGFAAVGMIATTAPGGWSWLPLLAPVAAVIGFLVLMGPFFDDEHADAHTDDATAAERPALGYE